MARYGDDPTSKARVPVKDWVVERPFDSSDYLDGDPPRYEGDAPKAKRTTREAAVRSVKASNLRAGHRLHRTSGVQTVSDVQTVKGALTGERRRVVLDGGDVQMFDPEERVSVSSETVESVESVVEASLRDAAASRARESTAERVERELIEAADSMAKASTPEPFSSSKTSNWVARAGGLPAYIQHIAHDLVEKRGKSESNAIQMAIGIVKRWARGGGKVDANTRAAAAKAVAEWEAMKAKNGAKSVAEAFELALLEAAWEAAESPEVIAEAERYEAVQDELLALAEAATAADAEDRKDGGADEQAEKDGIKVKCPKCGARAVPKNGKCAKCGNDVSKLAAFAKRLKGKVSEAEHVDAHELAVREAVVDGLA